VGRQVRYVAPSQVSDPLSVKVAYVATNASGATAPGTLDVTVIPRGQANEPPEPPTLEGRVVSGDSVKLRLPGSGVDPDEPIADNTTAPGRQKNRRIEFKILQEPAR
jgi:hypothetical protein